MTNKIKVFLIIFLSIFSFWFEISNASLKVEVTTWWSNNSNDAKIKNWIISSVSDLNVTNKTEVWDAFSFVKNQIYMVVWIIAVIMVVWIGVRMATSRGNPDEFKKSWLHLVYLILWLFLVFAAWWIVNIVANLGIFWK